MHRRAVVLADSKSMQEAPEQGMGTTWQGRPVPPNLLVDRAKKGRPMQGVRIRVWKVRGKRRSHVDREVTCLVPDTRDEWTPAVHAPVAKGIARVGAAVGATRSKLVHHVPSSCFRSAPPGLVRVR